MRIRKFIVLFLLLLLVQPLVRLPVEASPHTSDIVSLDYYVFGFIDGWYWENFSIFHFQVLNGSNFYIVGREKYTYSDSFSWGVIRRGWGWGFSGFAFKGILTQHFVLGKYYTHNKGGSSQVKPFPSRYLPLFIVDYFKGTIDELVIEGRNYSFLGVNLTMKEYWHIGGSWGIRVDHAKSDEMGYSRDDGYRVIGSVTPQYIKAAFVYFS